MNPLPIMFFTELFTDFNLVLKIFVLLTIYSWVKNHLGQSMISVAVMGVLCFFILFDFWKFFGGIYVLYMLVMMGISGILVDMFFVSGQSKGAGEKQDFSMSSGADLMAKRAIRGPTSQVRPPMMRR
jgi:hypothetical protein